MRPLRVFGFFPFALGVTAFAGILCTIAAPGATIKIADSTDGYTNFSLPALNDSGVVAFNATKAGSAKVFTGSGGAVSSFDPATLGAYPIYGDPSINNAGHVGFLVDSSDAIGLHTGAYRWDGGSAAITVLDPNSHGGIHDAWPVVTMSRGADDVYVAFSEEFAQGRIFTQSGLIILGAIYHLGRPVVSSNGMLIVTYASNNNGPTDGFYLSTPNNVHWNGLHVANDPNTIPPGSPETISYSTGYGSSIAINAAGTIALSLTGYSASNTPISNGTFAFDSSGNGTYLSAGSVSNLAINDLGTILPFGSGPDVSDLGSPVVSLDYIPDGLNNNNQIAFRATLANGTSGIYVSSIPEPGATLAYYALPLTGLLLSARRRRTPR